jgi:hypothetical protein
MEFIKLTLRDGRDGYVCFSTGMVVSSYLDEEARACVWSMHSYAGNNTLVRETPEEIIAMINNERKEMEG